MAARRRESYWFRKSNPRTQVAVLGVGARNGGGTTQVSELP